jgi:hypothetical protein
MTFMIWGVSTVVMTVIARRGRPSAPASATLSALSVCWGPLAVDS